MERVRGNAKLSKFPCKGGNAITNRTGGKNMLDNEYYSQDIHGPYELYNLGDFVLEEGGTIRKCTLAYASFGTLSPARDNAILVPTWFSGTNKIVEQAYIGPGRALDPEKYYII